MVSLTEARISWSISEAEVVHQTTGYGTTMNTGNYSGSSSSISSECKNHHSIMMLQRENDNGNGNCSSTEFYLKVSIPKRYDLHQSNDFYYRKFPSPPMPINTPKLLLPSNKFQQWHTQRNHQQQKQSHQHSPTIRLSLPLLFLSSLFLQLLVPTALAGLTFGSVSSDTICYKALLSAAGSDMLVNQTEYITFINILSNNSFTYPQLVEEEDGTSSWQNLPIVDFFMLPMGLQMNFNALACGGAFVSCSDAHLNANGAEGGATDQQIVYLHQTCTATDDAIDAAMGVSTGGQEWNPPSLMPTSPATASSSSLTATNSPTAATTPTPSSTTGESQAPSSLLVPMKVNLRLYYSIMVPVNITAAMAMDTNESVNQDLIRGMDIWMEGMLIKWNNEGGGRRERMLTSWGEEEGGRLHHQRWLNVEGEHRRRRSFDFLSTGLQSSLRGTGLGETIYQSLNSQPSRKLIVTVVSGSGILSNVTDIVCNNSVSIQEGDHCLTIVHDQTLDLVNETDSDAVIVYLTSAFNAALLDGSYLADIPEPTHSAIRAIAPAEGTIISPSSSSDGDSNLEQTVPITGDSIIGTSDSSSSGGGTKTVAIALGVGVALLVSVIGVFVFRRIRRQEEEKAVLLDDEDRNGEWDEDMINGPQVGNKDKKSNLLDEDSSSSSGSESDSDSSSSSGSYDTGESSSYYSNSGCASSSTSGVEESEPLSISASDIDSYASTSKDQTNNDSNEMLSKPVVKNEGIVSRDSERSNEILCDSMDSGSSVDEASLVEEAGMDEIESDSDDETDEHSDEDNHEYRMSVDLLKSGELEMAQEHSLTHNAAGNSKSSSIEDDSSVGSSGWESSEGESSTNTESVESYDPNIAEIGSSAVSGTTTTTTDDYEETLVDFELLPGIVNPALNPAVQRGVTMVPVMEDDDDNVHSISDDSASSDIIENRQDAAPMANEIQSAIEKGDWAAVGATAAILASEHSGPVDDHSSMISRSDYSDVVRGAEIDELVERGNWDGVVAIAARYVDDTSNHSGPSRSDHGSRSSNSRPRMREASPHSISTASVETAVSSGYTTSQESNTTKSYYSGSASYGTESDSLSHDYSNVSSTAMTSSYTSNATSSPVNDGALTNSMVSFENPEEKQALNSYRVEVEALIRRVVPDEIDNIDDIMIQFRGREEELIATLHSMQEASLAQRAKAAVQRSAKKGATRPGRPLEEVGENPSSTLDVPPHILRQSVTSTDDGYSITNEFVEGSSESSSDIESNYSSGIGTRSECSGSLGTSHSERDRRMSCQTETDDDGSIEEKRSKGKYAYTDDVDVIADSRRWPDP